MYNNLLRLYKLGRLTEEQKQTIMASRNQENS